SLFFYFSRHPLILHSFPTRRSSDLHDDSPGDPLGVRVCVLGSGSRGNSTLVVTEKTRLLVDAGFSKKETCARLASVGECAGGCADRKSTRLNSSHVSISYAVFCLKK